MYNVVQRYKICSAARAGNLLDSVHMSLQRVQGEGREHRSSSTYIRGRHMRQMTLFRLADSGTLG
jgi:hypothetical protein